MCFSVEGALLPWEVGPAGCYGSGGTGCCVPALKFLGLKYGFLVKFVLDVNIKILYVVFTLSSL